MKIVSSSHAGTTQKIPTSTPQMTKVVVVCMANSTAISSSPVITQVNCFFFFSNYCYVPLIITHLSQFSVLMC